MNRVEILEKNGFEIRYEEMDYWKHCPVAYKDGARIYLYSIRHKGNTTYLYTIYNTSDIIDYYYKSGLIYFYCPKCRNFTVCDEYDMIRRCYCY